MILSDKDIKERINSGSIKIESKYENILDQVGPASLDFRLGNSFKYYKRDNLTVIDTKSGIESKHLESVYVEDGDSFILHPRQFILGVTAELISCPRDLVARCEGRSSLGRLGLIIHSTAGFIDPGFTGTITLEITNINEIPIKLYPGMRIGQFAFETLTSPCDISYDERKGSKYMNQVDPQESKIYDDKN